MFGRHRMYQSHWEGRPFQKGDLKYIILGLVAEKPRHGYEIIRSLEERSHGFYAPSPGAVYPTLQFLEEAGYVSAAEHEGKKTYTVTDEGRQFLREQKDFAEGIKKHMSDMWGAKSGVEAREVMTELRRLARLMRHHHWGRRPDPEKMGRIREVISHACDEIEAILAE